MQAITTKFISPTNTRGSRIKATCDAKSITINWDYSLDVSANHTAAANKLASELGWKGEWFGGSGKDGYVFVCANRTFSDRFTI